MKKEEGVSVGCFIVKRAAALTHMAELSGFFGKV